VRGLLERTLVHDPKRFCTLILEVVRTAIGYRQAKDPITRDEIEVLDELVQRVGFRIKDLSEPAFLASLPTRVSSTQTPSRHADMSVSSSAVDGLKEQLNEIASRAPVARGFKFETFLGELFEAYALAPRSSFRLVGEQIDGSFELDGQPYLVEAKWHGAAIGQADLLVFSGKVSGKAQWSRGLLVSYSGFTPDGLSAFRMGKPTNIVCVDRADLAFVLSGKATLPELLRRKVRRAAEENSAYVPASKLFA